MCFFNFFLYSVLTQKLGILLGLDVGEFWIGMHVCFCAIMYMDAYVCTYIHVYIFLRSYHVCMHVCMYVCMYVRMYVRMYVCLCFFPIWESVLVCMYVCMYVTLYICMHIRVYVCLCMTACMNACMHNEWMHACMYMKNSQRHTAEI